MEEERGVWKNRRQVLEASMDGDVDGLPSSDSAEPRQQRKKQRRGDDEFVEEEKPLWSSEEAFAADDEPSPPTAKQLQAAERQEEARKAELAGRKAKKARMVNIAGLRAQAKAGNMTAVGLLGAALLSEGERGLEREGVECLQVSPCIACIRSPAILLTCSTLRLRRGGVMTMPQSGLR